jgi:glycosyltransferase involved in cell wall biosynthesis
MLLKKPVISSRTSGAMEILDNKNLFFGIENHDELSEKMVQLINNPNFPNEVLENNYSRALQFDINNVFLEIRKTFNQIL